jgi:hypothetical protein
MRWLTIRWYQYLLSSFYPEYYRRTYKFPGWKVIYCRIRNHPHGVFFHNPGGSEPDMRCINCSEDLG